MHHALLAAFLDHYVNIAHSLSMNSMSALMCRTDPDSLPQNQGVAKGERGDGEGRDAGEPRLWPWH